MSAPPVLSARSAASSRAANSGTAAGNGGVAAGAASSVSAVATPSPSKQAGDRGFARVPSVGTLSAAGVVFRQAAELFSVFFTKVNVRDVQFATPGHLPTNVVTQECGFFSPFLATRKKSEKSRKGKNTSLELELRVHKQLPLRVMYTGAASSAR
jgi:hypothetical protein